MSVRQLQLHAIIKNLQSKILTLKEEQKIINQRYELRVRQLNEENKKILDDKDKTIEYLRSDMDKDRQLILLEQKTYDSCISRQKLTLIGDLEKFKAKCSQLQKRVQKTTERYELRTKELEEENLRLREVVSELNNSSRMSLQSEIDKLARYYQTSRIEQVSRTKTVEWIQRLNDFIDRFYSQNDKATKQNLSFLQLGLQNLKKDLITPIKALNEQDEALTKERRALLTKIHEIVEEQTKMNQESSDENERLWQLMKKQKNSQQIQKISNLEKELSSANVKSQEESKQLINRIKQLENQRKTLLLGFTELKSLNDSREKTYRDQISALKVSIEELLGGIQRREADFENQIRTLHLQLSNLNQRYYDNIEVPLNNLSGKIDVELKAARLEIQKLTDNKGFIKLVQNLESTLQRYVQEQGIATRLSYELTQYARRTQSLVILGKQILESETQKKLFSPQFHLQPTLQMQDKMMIIQTGMKEVEWKQRQNKLNYEVSTLKKHNKKLKDLNTNLENQIYQRNSSAFKCKHHNHSCSEKASEANAKTIELQKEIQSLRTLNQTYQEEFMYQMSIMKDSMKKLTGKELHQNSELARFQEGIVQTKECNQKILIFLERQNSHIKAVRDTLSTLDRILVKPVQVFDQFISMIGKCYMPFTFQSNTGFKNQTLSFVPFQKLQSAYSDIAIKRQDNGVSTNRLTAQLIRTLRESIPANFSKSKGNSQEVQEEKLEKSRISRQVPLQKKIKELQSQKIKNREEVLRKIEKIEETLKVMDQKMSKRGSINPSRLEEGLDKKLIELSERYMSKSLDSASELSQITTSALKELKAKLKQCMTENEGLMKEIQYIHLLNRQTE